MANPQNKADMVKKLSDDIEEQRDNPIAVTYLLRALTYRDLNRLEDAVADTDRGIECCTAKDPQTFINLCNLRAELCLDLNHIEKADETVKWMSQWHHAMIKQEEQAPNVQSHLLAGRVAVAKSNFGEAEKIFVRAIILAESKHSGLLNTAHSLLVDCRNLKEEQQNQRTKKKNVAKENNEKNKMGDSGSQIRKSQSSKKKGRK